MRGLKGGGRVAVGRADNRFLGRKRRDVMAEHGRGERVSKWGDGRERWANGVMREKGGQVGVMGEKGGQVGVMGDESEQEGGF